MSRDINTKGGAQALSPANVDLWQWTRGLAQRNSCGAGTPAGVGL